MSPTDQGTGCSRNSIASFSNPLQSIPQKVITSRDLQSNTSVLSAPFGWPLSDNQLQHSNGEVNCKILNNTRQLEASKFLRNCQKKTKICVFFFLSGVNEVYILSLWPIKYLFCLTALTFLGLQKLTYFPGNTLSYQKQKFPPPKKKNSVALVVSRIF